MKKCIFIGCFCMAFLLLSVMTKSGAYAAPGDLFVQVDDDNEPSRASILHITPAGVLSEWVSNAAILAATGESSADFSDTGMAVAGDGTIYFSEDVSHDILMVSPAGVVSVFVDSTVIDAVVGTSNDIDNGLILGQDGNLYAADEDADCIFRVTLPGGAVSIVVTEAQILAATGESDVELEGGIARDTSGNFYIADDESDSIVKVTSGGVASVLTSDTDITAVTGNGEPDLDVAVALDGDLFVLDDGGGDDDAVLRINTTSGAVSLVAQAPAIQAVTGIPGSSDDAVDLEGGMAINSSGVLFIGDDGADENENDYANIVRVTQAGSVTLFVSNAQLTSFYAPLYSNPPFDPRLLGSMAFQATAAASIPTLSEWGMIIFSLLLGSFAVLYMRKQSHGERMA